MAMSELCSLWEQMAKPSNGLYEEFFDFAVNTRDRAQVLLDY